MVYSSTKFLLNDWFTAAWQGGSIRWWHTQQTAMLEVKSWGKRRLWVAVEDRDQSSISDRASLHCLSACHTRCMPFNVKKKKKADEKDVGYSYCAPVKASCFYCVRAPCQLTCDSISILDVVDGLLPYWQKSQWITRSMFNYSCHARTAWTTMTASVYKRAIKV